MNAVTSSELAGQLHALGHRLDLLDSEFDKLAEAAVQGDADASRKAAEVHEAINRLGVDRRVLEAAQKRATEAEARACDAAESERRARLVDAARDHAKTQLAAARKVDAALSELAECLAVLSETEAAIRTALGQARFAYCDAIVGQRGLALLAIEKANELIDGRRRLRGPGKPIAEVAARAWDFLLADGDDNG